MADATPAEDAAMRLTEAVLDRVAQTSSIEVPQELVDCEAARMVGEYNHRMKYGSIISGRYLDLIRDDSPDCLEKLREEAYKLVKIRLVLREIIEAEDFEITKEELEEEAKAISFRQQIPIELIKDFLGEDLQLLKDDLLVKKAIDFIRFQAVIN